MSENTRVIDSFVCVDLGASGTRVTSKAMGIFDLPNNARFVEVGSGAINVSPNRDENDKHNDVVNNIDVTITKTSGAACEHFPCRVVMGDMADRFSASCERPSIMRNKVDQRINYVSTIVAVAHQVMIGAVDGTNLLTLVALPPMEAAYNSEGMIEKLKGTYKVVFNKLGTEVNLELAKVMCVEESFMGLTTFFFNDNGAPREEADEFKEGYVLSLDIGSSTTDMTMAKNRRYVEKSGQTFKVGCNIIQAYMGNVIRAKYGEDANQEGLDEVTATGRYRRGNRYDEMCEALYNAKRELAMAITEQLQSYFRLNNLPLSMVRAIVVHGGGSMTSGYKDKDGKFIKTCGPVSDFITTELNKIVDGIEVIPITDDPRHANIRGMRIKAMIELIMMKKAAEAQAQG